MRMHNFYLFIIWLTSTIKFCGSVCSHLYGAEPCTYLPAPPGKTPRCARPGVTYCEHPDQYPGQLINFLVKKWKYDHSTLFSSESQEEFSSYFYPPINPVYGPPNYRPPGVQYPHQRSYPEPIYIPKPQYPFQENGINYIPQNHYAPQNFTAYPDAGNAKYTNPYSPPVGPWYQPYQHQQHQQQMVDHPQYGHYNNLWKRSISQNNKRYKRSLRFKRNPKTYLHKFSNGTAHHRSKRQSAGGQRELCQVRSQYIVPRAALNNKGNWMYVVNMPEVDNRVTQLVKSEVCASQTCDGICSLPDGYTSRCEQKYVQKRLVALEGSGSQLYTDVFWFPSCCQCTLYRS